MEIINIISSIRNSFEGSIEVYTKGSCYRFFEILKSIHPEAEAYYDSNHVITKIGDKFYDITGEVKCENHIPIENFGDKTMNFFLEYKYDIWVLRNRKE